MATCDDPRVAPAVIAAFPRLGRAARMSAIDSLLARESSLRVLLDSLADGRLEKRDITHAQARQVARVAPPDLASVLMKPILTSGPRCSDAAER